MPTKTVLEEQINEILGTDLKFSKMTKNDLQRLKMMVEEGLLLEPMAKQMAKEKSKEEVEQQIEDWYPGKFVTQVL